ncbi:MAG: PilZ domain-containing protein [Hyphomicrobiales bacterium]|nr:PilZ domain-containing protein [Hyphomicrobiales bacterium]MBV9115238.1 PilZ domain-containing protein [Hyphomicrobiales bacterium]MBV9517026.1 PilZ domain-containing protein [Hyphomicrobiales bacterium]MBV9518912.1 PilZ domain-containing protein [Hyphomicrobiales bacterium]
MVQERRKSYRFEWNASAFIYDCAGEWGCPCIIKDLSRGGAKIAGVIVHNVPDEFMLRISRARGSRKCHVLWRQGDKLGVGFIEHFASVDEPSTDRTRRAPARRAYA